LEKETALSERLNQAVARKSLYGKGQKEMDSSHGKRRTKSKEYEERYHEKKRQ